ncbi:MAG: hypothetical protein IJT14_03715 [Rickettsiales bacterium]|nr:hypothetical protein [Rickettsiales bacterium]
MNYTNGKTDLTDKQITELVTKKIQENEDALKKLEDKSTLTPDDLRELYESWMSRMKEIWCTVHNDVWEEPREPATNLVTIGSEAHWNIVETRGKEIMQMDLGENKIVCWSSTLKALINEMVDINTLEKEEYNKLTNQLERFEKLGASSKVQLAAGGTNCSVLDAEKLLELSDAVEQSNKEKGK